VKKVSREVLMARARKKAKKNMPKAYFRHGDYLRASIPPTLVPFAINFDERNDDYIVARVVRKYSNGETYDLVHVPSQIVMENVLIVLSERCFWKLCSRPKHDT